MGASREDARDLFQDALIVLYEKCRQDPYFQVDHPSAYLCAVARRLWQHQRTGGAATTEALPEDQVLGIPDDFYAQDQKEFRLLGLLEKAGQKCLQILQAFYYHEWSLSEIARHFGYRSVRSATVQKYKCLEKVREYTQQKSNNYASSMDQRPAH